jgi:hypothetical protein
MDDDGWSSAINHQPYALSHQPSAMTMSLRRIRGSVLRLVRRRTPAMLVGAALIAPAAWVEFSGRFGAWWQDGLALVVGATGIAILWTGLTGVAPDWVDTDTDADNG